MIIFKRLEAYPHKKKMKIYTLDQITNELVGKVGTANRDVFEFEFQIELVGRAIKQIRKERKLTQEQLGKLVGVQKSQISRLENNANNVTLGTWLRILKALKAKVTLQVLLPNLNVRIGKQQK